jgi:hypothetical protein
METAWIKEFPAAIIVCDRDGIILEMNDIAARSLSKSGGSALIGNNMRGCHSDACLGKLEQILTNPHTNTYINIRNGIQKLIFQSPWYSNGEYSGFVQISFEIPNEIPRFVRS